MDFIDSAIKKLEKTGVDVGASEPPRYWYSTGNYVLNKIISGDFNKGIPQGRLICYSGASGTGKSFLAANAMKEAQAEGAHIVVLDSENALDDDFVTAIGVDVTKNYTYVPVTTIPDVKKVVSAFITSYKKEYGDDNDAPQVLFVIDSLDMLLTETEEEQFEKGITKGDQGQRNKQLKAMLRAFVQHIKKYNISMVVTSQVYKNQDVRNGEGVWIVSEAVKYSLSQIVLLTKLKLKEDTDVIGIRMKCEGYKTRFTKPFQTVTIEVPYDTGMDPYNGLLDVAKDLSIVTQKGSRYCITGESKTWYKKEFSEYAEAVLAKCSEQNEVFLLAEDEEESPIVKEVSMKQKRKRKIESSIDAE